MKKLNEGKPESFYNVAKIVLFLISFIFVSCERGMFVWTWKDFSFLVFICAILVFFGIFWIIYWIDKIITKIKKCLNKNDFSKDPKFPGNFRTSDKRE